MYNLISSTRFQVLIKSDTHNKQNTLFLTVEHFVTNSSIETLSKVDFYSM